MSTQRLLDSIKLHEGKRLGAYQDSVGVWTIGYGTNLQVLEIGEELAQDWLEEEVDKMYKLLAMVDGFPDAEYIPDEGHVRQDVLIEMAYQLGFAGCKKFKKMWAALERHDYWAAASEMLDSRWAREQTPARAQTLAARMRTGKWDNKEDV